MGNKYVKAVHLPSLLISTDLKCSYTVHDADDKHIQCEVDVDHAHLMVNDKYEMAAFIGTERNDTNEYMFMDFKKLFGPAANTVEEQVSQPEVENASPDLTKKILEILERSEITNVTDILKPTSNNVEPEAGSSYRVPIGTRFDLIPPLAIRRLADVYGEGAVTYGENEYLSRILKASNVINHMVNHLLLFMAGDKKEDHAAKVAWGAFTLMVLEELKPDMLDVRNYGKALEDESMLSSGQVSS